MSGGGGGDSDTTVTQRLNERQQRLLDLAEPFFTNVLSESGLKDLRRSLFKKRGVAGFNPTETAGQQQILGAAQGNLSSVADTARRALEFFTGAGLDPTTNPNLQAAIGAAQRPLFENLTESVLPAIRGEERATGSAFGGSRRGIAEGLASGRTATAAGDVSANIANQGFQNALRAGVVALSQAPQVGQLQLAPGLATSAVGQQQRQLAQQQLDDILRRQGGSSLLPFTLANELARIAFGIPGGSTSTQQSLGGGGFSPVQGALGGAGAGALFGGPAGAAGGALLGGLGSLFF